MSAGSIHKTSYLSIIVPFSLRSSLSPTQQKRHSVVVVPLLALGSLAMVVFVYRLGLVGFNAKRERMIPSNDGKIWTLGSVLLLLVVGHGAETKGTMIGWKQ
jgi:hypothetical protein